MKRLLTLATAGMFTTGLAVLPLTAFADSNMATGSDAKSAPAAHATTTDTKTAPASKDATATDAGKAKPAKPGTTQSSGAVKPSTTDSHNKSAS